MKGEQTRNCFSLTNTLSQALRTALPTGDLIYPRKDPSILGLSPCAISATRLPPSAVRNVFIIKHQEHQMFYISFESSADVQKFIPPAINRLVTNKSKMKLKPFTPANFLTKSRCSPLPALFLLKKWCTFYNYVGISVVFRSYTSQKWYVIWSECS